MLNNWTEWISKNQYFSENNSFYHNEKWPSYILILKSCHNKIKIFKSDALASLKCFTRKINIYLVIYLKNFWKWSRLNRKLQPPFRQGGGPQSSTFCSHLTPLKPGGHWHENRAIKLWQTPPLRHGLDRHWSISWSHRSPLKPWVQMQWKPPFISWQTAPFRQGLDSHSFKTIWHSFPL